jgi:hypothetical protein
MLPALADWNVGDPNKWEQLPLLVGGYDVASMIGSDPSGAPVNTLVADDWQCLDPRPVTDIHIWGSWWNDSVAPGWVPTFELSIYSDIPAGTGGVSHSRPGNLLWTTVQSPLVRPWDPLQQGVDPAQVTEQFFDPNPGSPVAQPTFEYEVWQYNFFLDQPFEQIQDEIYWLSVQTVGLENFAGHYWGWKTSETQWNDDAAWLSPLLAGTDWQELYDPPGGESLDMAFVLTVPEPRIGGLAVGLALAGIAFWHRRRRA